MPSPKLEVTTGDPIDAETAKRIGLVNEVVPYEKLDEAVENMCKKLVNKFPECMRYTKVQTNFWKDLAWNQTAAHALDWLTLHVKSRETREGMTSFAEKRPTEYLKLRELSLKSETMVCSNCGADDIPEGFKYCGRCGKEIPAGRT